MKKNTMMRIASCMLVAILLTTSVISGTFAKYVTKAGSQDSARVATWGFKDASIDITGLFKDAYDNTVQGKADVIAPGTANSASFKFNYDATNGSTTPEVDYTFTVDTTGSTIADDIKNNTNITWSLDGGAYGDWDTLMDNIALLSGDASGTKTYKAGTAPTGFTTADENHTISWKWAFEDATKSEEQDAKDTAMGNKATLDEVKIVINVTATQVD